MDRKAIETAIENAGDIFSSISIAQREHEFKVTPAEWNRIATGYQQERAHLSTLIEAARAYLELTAREDYLSEVLED